MKIFLISMIMMLVVVGDQIGDFLRDLKMVAGDILWGILFLMAGNDPEFDNGDWWNDD